MRRYAIAVFVLLYAAPALFADETNPLGRITVTPSRLMTRASDNLRSVVILEDPDFSVSVYRDIPDIVGNIAGIDIRRRGPEGVQADIDIRGTTFEQNTILIDGVRSNDPQTGHFNMDLPITMLDVARIEVLKGPASSLYGPNSFGGVINIITKRPAAAAIRTYQEGGSYDYYRGALSAEYSVGALSDRFSIEESRSAGYMSGTAFNIMSVSNSAYFKTVVGECNFLFGYTKKDFEADSFYSNIYSNEEEHTDTRFFKLDGTLEFGSIKMLPKLFLRRHRDKFMLDQNRPGWQTNYSTNYSYGGEIGFMLENGFMDLSYGYELSGDSIDSTNLQTHTRTRDGFYLELSPHLFNELELRGGVRSDYVTGFGWECSPSVCASYAVLKDLNIRGSIGRSYRIPTFTDLYYNDAANAGDAGLVSENSWTYESGFSYAAGYADLSATYFYRDNADTIDWIRSGPREKWHADNIGSARTNGFELFVYLYPKRWKKDLGLEKAFLHYTVLDTYAKHDYLSKYALDYLKQQISTGLECEILGFKNSWVLNYKKRVGDSGYIVVDTKVSRNMVKRGRVLFDLFLEISNLFSISYSEQSDVSMPSRWIKSGVRAEF